MTGKFDVIYMDYYPDKHDEWAKKRRIINQPIRNKGISANIKIETPIKIWDPLEKKSHSHCLP